MKKGYRYRCSVEKCKTRVTLPKRIEEYVRPPKCKVCGGSRFRLDTHRQKHEIGAGLKKCYCDGYHYPHREGAGVWCKHHPTGPTTEDFEERYGRNLYGEES